MQEIRNVKNDDNVASDRWMPTDCTYAGIWIHNSTIKLLQAAWGRRTVEGLLAHAIERAKKEIVDAAVEAQRKKNDPTDRGPGRNYERDVVEAGRRG